MTNREQLQDLQNQILRLKSKQYDLVHQIAKEEGKKLWICRYKSDCTLTDYVLADNPSQIRDGEGESLYFDAYYGDEVLLELELNDRR